MKKIIILLLLSLMSNSTFGQKHLFRIMNDSTIIRKENNLVIKDFEKRIKKIDKSIDFRGLKTVVKDSMLAGMYLPSNNRIYLSPWHTTPAIGFEFCTRVMGSKAEGEKLAAMFFYGFFLPHEVAHGLQFYAKVRKDNEFDNEYEANVIALLYWKKRAKNKEMAECYKIAKKALLQLKNPFPENVDKKKYFTTHYEAMGQNLDQYGYVQLDQIVKIFEDKNLPDFDTYIRQYISKKSN